MLLIYSIDNIIVMDNLLRLRIFSHISKTRNFTETARQLHLAQPAVSRHIKSLEDELGCALFFRQQKKVLLTDAGKNLLFEISPLISEFDRIFSDFTNNRADTKGTLKIGSIAEACHYRYMEHLIGFQKEYPNIQIIVEYGGSDILQQRLFNGELDFALVSRYSDSKGLEAIPLFKDRAVLIAPSSKKNVDLEIQKLPFVEYREDDYYTADFLKRNFTAQMRKNIQKLGSVSSHESIFQWIVKREAFCVVPNSSYEKSKYKNQMKVVKEDQKETTLHLIYLYNAKAELRKKVFLDKMRKIAIINKLR